MNGFQDEMTTEELIAETERELAFARKAGLKGAMNLVDTERDRARYREDSKKIGWEPFVHAADVHYFVGRILMSNGVFPYCFFCAQQCVENYLKAVFKFVGEQPPNEHNLQKLLNEARIHISDKTSFLHSEYAETVCQKYDPFYELPRYPTQISRPKDGLYMSMTGEENILDYFVYRMREILALPSDSRDILRDSHYELLLCKNHFPGFYEQFKIDNLNFSKAQ